MGVLEADLGAPRKQRHTARRIYDRLVAERGYAGSYTTVQRFVRDLRLARAAGGEGYLEPGWAPGTCQVDFGNFRAAIGGRTLGPMLLVATLPHSNDRQCVALMSQRSECLCAGLPGIFRRWGRAPAAMVLDNATEAGGMVLGEVTESRLFSQFRAHYRFESRYCSPYSGNERGSVENAVGFLRRNLLVPVPAFGTLPELNAFLAEGCARVNAAARCRDGRPHGEAYREDLAAMRALPGAEFDAVRWVTARADKRGYVEADGSPSSPGPSGRAPRSGTPSRSCPPSSPGPGPSGSRRSGATCRRGSSRGSVGWTPPAGGARSGRSAGRASPRASRRPARRRSGSSRAPRPRRRHGRRAGEAHRGRRRRGRWRRPVGLRRVPEGGGHRWPPAGSWPAGSWRPGGRARSPPPGLEEWSRLGTPKQVECLAGYLEAERPGREASKRATLLRRCALPAPKTFDGYDWSAVSWPEDMGRELPLAPDFVERR